VAICVCACACVTMGWGCLAPPRLVPLAVCCGGTPHVPHAATAVQGAISLEHKAKQAVGGVQLVRLSFPPVCDVDLVSKIIGDTVASLYK
jgi:hypothetical protein